MFSISSWFSLGRLYLSKNLSISSRLSLLLVAHSGLFQFFVFCAVSYNFSFFVSDFIDLVPSAFFLDEFG